MRCSLLNFNCKSSSTFIQLPSSFPFHARSIVNSNIKKKKVVFSSFQPRCVPLTLSIYQLFICVLVVIYNINLLIMWWLHLVLFFCKKCFWGHFSKSFTFHIVKITLKFYFFFKDYNLLLINFLSLFYFSKIETCIQKGDLTNSFERKLLNSFCFAHPPPWKPFI